MKTLTVRQPWADLIAAGSKRIENRSWPTAHRGPLAIHAARPVGAVVAVVELVACVRVEQLPADLAADPHAVGPWCWILAGARIIEPIPCRGRLGIWEGPDPVPGS